MLQQRRRLLALDHSHSDRGTGLLRRMRQRVQLRKQLQLRKLLLTAGARKRPCRTSPYSSALTVRYTSSWMSSTVRGSSSLAQRITVQPQSRTISRAASRQLFR